MTCNRFAVLSMAIGLTALAGCSPPAATPSAQIAVSAAPAAIPIALVPTPLVPMVVFYPAPLPQCGSSDHPCNRQHTEGPILQR